MTDKLPILAHGEVYVTPVARKPGGGAKERPHAYEEAKSRLLGSVGELVRSIDADPDLYLDEKVVCIRLEPNFEAKSYTPDTMLRVSEEMSIVGGRQYRLKNEAGCKSKGTALVKDASSEGEDQEAPEKAKLYFVRTTTRGLRDFENVLRSGQYDSVKRWREELTSVRSFDMLDPSEKIQGFDDSWESGAVEVVLHPLGQDAEKAVELFCRNANVGREDIEVRSYPDGVTFIAARLSREAVESVARINPLRTAHPMGRVRFEPMMRGLSAAAPHVSPKAIDPEVTVGVFDGGCNPSVPLLSGYVTAHDCVASSPMQAGIDHGGAVCGVILHGELNGKTVNDTLPAPDVSVESYRVLPQTDPADYELYEAIDVIEDVVPKREDIGIYNISFGPVGPILDDDINRFTYSLDTLTSSAEQDREAPLFSIAVGNDGDLPDPSNRIQAPSDLVNGLAVGAYTYDAHNDPVRAGYSCIGPGREGLKVKPDLLEFGGDMGHPFIVADMSGDKITGAAGTSFASPLAVHKMAAMLAHSEDITPQMARAIMVQCATHDESYLPEEYGHGLSPKDGVSCLSCSENSVTTLYQGILRPTELVSLPLFAPSISSAKGMVDIRWTIVGVCAVDPNDTDAYTRSCIYDTFMPHAMKFNFHMQGHGNRKLDLTDDEQARLAEYLQSQGYQKSDLPASDTPKANWEEADLRAKDLKWDTVIHKHVRKRATSLLRPSLTLQSIFRGVNDPMAFTRYYAVATIDAPGYQGSLYTETLNQYKYLQPIRVRVQNRIENQSGI